MYYMFIKWHNFNENIGSEAMITQLQVVGDKIIQSIEFGCYALCRKNVENA